MLSSSALCTTDGLEVLPSDIKEFSSESYWDNFYIQQEQKTFEWYLSSKDIGNFLVCVQNEYLNSNSISCLKDVGKVLEVGCGNSALAMDLYYHYSVSFIKAIDFSHLAIQEMKKKHKQYKDLKNKGNLYTDIADHHNASLSFEVMDVLNMSFMPNTFEWVLDKGLFDAMMEDAREENQKRSITMFRGICDVLQPGGCYFLFTLAQDHILDLLCYILITTANGSRLPWCSLTIHPLCPTECVSSLSPFVFVFKKQIQSSPFLFNMQFINQKCERKKKKKKKKIVEKQKKENNEFRSYKET